MQIVYYSNRVQKDIESFHPEIKAKTDAIIALLEKYGQIALPGKTKQWEGNIWEITANGKSNWGRVLYVTVRDEKMFIIYGFLKKSNTTPNNIAQLVRHRAKEVENAQKNRK